MRAVVLNCSLKSGSNPSNTQLLADSVIAALTQRGVESRVFRIADLAVPPGVETDLGDGDEWPQVHEALLSAEILVVATPTWVGRPSSIAQRVLERMDAMISETTPEGLPVAYNKVAGVVITGNEDGAHHIVGTTIQSLIDIGFSAPGHGWTYWHLGPGAGPDYLEDSKGHAWSDRVGRNAAHNLMALAKALKAAPLPKPEMES